ncbi:MULTISPECIES: tripartite tricarboxylate transporter TctB family protein [Neisseria]|uniref:Tripartite tricarboxylate transporter TctB family protein n=1 Tax=Neisseria musculi TaxID=1815583 RepID=A0A7H1MC04_9NEIS|nr:MULTISPECIES: tripartite tricarboxylate transporter TctB family protein [Neisseria]MBF0802860.1 tripartite tricarboxylate transporter TctB family protein [Neisseria sp. 19428wB4_WF04]QNT59169.1 tripartite tricarboxylate transporter TctB family protein [Neisseria musculi]TFU44665.1 tripartite tricarboxylate transporter TctB family protein [Neisseria sp. WF04]
MKIERLFSAALFSAAIGLLCLAFGYTAPVSYDPLGPRPYPMLVLSLLALCCLFLAVRPRGGHINLGYTPAVLKKVGLCIVFLSAYAALFEVLGFPLATALMAFGVGRLFGGRTLPCAVSGMVLGALFYALFDLALDVPLPLGFFG